MIQAIALLLLCAAPPPVDIPTGLPWRDDHWRILERGSQGGYTIYEHPTTKQPRIIIHGFGMRSSMRAGGSRDSESWRHYETYHYRIDQYGNRYNERRIEN